MQFSVVVQFIFSFSSDFSGESHAALSCYVSLLSGSRKSSFNFILSLRDIDRWSIDRVFYLKCSPNLGLSHCFLTMGFRVCICWQVFLRSSQGTVSRSSSYSDFGGYPLFFLDKSLFFTFVINKRSMWRSLETTQIHHCLRKNLATVLVSFDDSCPY